MGGFMKKVKFIHAADLHLDSPFQGLKRLETTIFQRVKESTFAAFHKVIEYAIEYKVDFILLAGDLFDGENRSLKAQWVLKKGLEELQRHHINCYIIHGNHDHLNGQYTSIEWPNNTYVFKSEIDFFRFQKNELSIHIYGYSYPSRNVQENIASSFNKVGHADFHLGLLHGTADGQVGHDCYAPFSIKQLLDKQFDYWALGHIHKRQILSENPYIVYSGNIQGRHKKEQGEKGIYLVELDTASDSKLRFLPTSQIYWEESIVTINEMKTVDELKNSCEEKLNALRKPIIGTLVSFCFQGTGPLHSFLVEEVEQLIEALNVEEEQKQAFTLIIDWKVETTGEWDRQQLKQGEHISKDIVYVVDDLLHKEEPLRPLLEEINSQQMMKKYLVPFTIEEQQELLKEAENYVLAALLKERKE